MIGAMVPGESQRLISCTELIREVLLGDSNAMLSGIGTVRQRRKLNRRARMARTGTWGDPDVNVAC